MPESADGRSPTRSLLPALAAVMLLAAALVLWVQSASDGLYGYDGYYHIRYAQILREDGISRSFPWWQETFLRERFADKGFLYHLLLIPFTFGDLASGGKAAAAFFAAIAAGIFYIAVERLRAPWPFLWSLLLLASSTAFLYRLGFTRPLVLAVALAIAGGAAIFLGRAGWAFALAALYPYVHISYHLLPSVALLHDLHRRAEPAGGRSFRITGWTCAGAAAGALLNPYLPNNLYLWWVQNLRVLGIAWSAPADLGLGLEIRPGGSDQLLKYNIGVFLLLAVAVYLLARCRRRASSESLSLLVISCGFLALSMMSRRFIEFWTPFTVLLAAVATRDFVRGRPGPEALGEGPEAGSTPAAPGGPASSGRLGLAGVPALIVAGGLLVHSATGARAIVATDRGLKYAAVSQWMSEEVPAGETIFHLDWDDFPQLFFFNPQFKYLVGLDPTFMYVTDPQRWSLWRDVTHGDVDDIYTPIRKTFGCRWVLGIPEAVDFMRIARRDPRFSPKYEDEDATLFELADGLTFVTEWRVTGWYPNPARRLFAIPLGPEAGPPDPPSRPEPSGPAAHGLNLSTASGFLDLAAVTRLPPTIQEACAAAETALAGGEGGPATLAIATDDEYRIQLDGEEVAAFSPLLTPLPGRPGGPPVTLDEFIASAGASAAERLHVVRLGAGPNRVTVKVCRVGEEFGFYLRAYGPDGAPLEAAALPSTSAP